MYRHLLVPLDDSPLAVDIVHQAVTFARTLGAKVTFFHAQADYGASSVGALERVISPATFNEHMAGEARAILAKAAVVARVAGVPHDTAIMTSDRPHEAILHVAEVRGCDLIFIASAMDGMSGSRRARYSNVSRSRERMSPFLPFGF